MIRIGKVMNENTKGYSKTKDDIDYPDSPIVDLSEEQWCLLLLALLTDVPFKEWNEFVHDLVYKNRYSSSHKVVDVIKDFSGKCTNTIKKGQVLYRARVYHQDPLREFLSEVFMNNTEKIDSDVLGNNNDYYNMKLAAFMMAVDKKTSRGEEIIYAYKKWQRKRFKGYNPSGSGAPPADNTLSGRLNPERIRYLYLAEDPETAVYEVRPTIEQHVSVATFKTKDDLKIYDLAGEIKPQEGERSDNDYSLFDVIRQRFSEPNSGDAFKYLPTQYLGEIIKQMGFDGLRFNSSLKKGGINVVLFDDKKCKAIRSDIIKVGNIELKFDNPYIYQLEEFIDLGSNKGD